MSKRDFMAGYMAARRDMGKVAYQASDMENFGEYTQGAFSGTCLSSRLTNGQWLVIDLSAQINNAGWMWELSDGNPLDGYSGIIEMSDDSWRRADEAIDDFFRTHGDLELADW